ncbi:MAG: 2-hydroxyacyl-CoA dehydratase family protein, partial [Oscillospiraceae bacterium]
KLFNSDISGEAVKAWKASGKKALGYVCCHVPEEVFYAADVLPVRLRATGCVDSNEAEAWMSSFSCSFARSILQYLMNGTYDLDGLVQSDGCMMATRILDNWEHVSKKAGKSLFFHQIGAPRITNDITVDYYKSEIAELVAALEKFSGNKITDASLKAACAKTNEMRALIAEIYDLRKAANPVITGEEVLKITLAECDMPIDEYIAALKEFLADVKTRKPVEVRARLLVIGSALDNPEYLKVIEDKGGIVVADALCFGSKAFGPQIVVDDKDVLGSIASYYLTRNTCPRSLDNRPAIHKEILDLCKEYDVQGVIYEKMQNCECWGGESFYLEPALKAAGIPMLQLEREEHMANAGQLAIRAEAFVEMIEK